MNETKSKTSPNASSGHQPNGRFAKGNKYGKGNPHCKRVSEIRKMLLDETEKRVDVIINNLLEMAVAKDKWAIAQVLDRTIGKPVPSDMQQKLDEMEQRLESALSAITNAHESAN